MMNGNFQDHAPLEEKLIRAGGFNPDDLMLNQAGELSPRQRRWLRLEAAAWMTQAGIDLAFIVCIWIFLYFQHNAQILLAGGLFWGFALGVSVFLCIQHARPIQADIQGNQVESMAGTISKRSGSGMKPHWGKRRVTIYWGLGIRNHWFSVHPQLYASIIEHRTYRLFYTPSLKRVINIEPLFLSDAEKQSILAALQGRMRNDEE